MEKEKRKIGEVEKSNGNTDSKKAKVPITAPQITKENKKEISKKVLKQIHFYFSDSNMNDRFLRKKISEHSEGFVELSVLTSFNRMKSICVDIPFILKLLKEKSNKVIVKGEMVKRSTPWPTEDTSLQRTIFAKNLPQQWTMDEVETFFENYGTVNRVFMMRNKDNFEGNVLIEYDTVEQFNKAMEAKPMVDGKIIEISAKKASAKDNNNNNDKKDKKEKKEKKDVEKKDEKETYIKFTGLNTESNFKTIKELFKNHGKPWVIYEHNADHGYLKFKSEEEAKEYLKKITEAKLIVTDKELKYEIVKNYQPAPVEKIIVYKFSGIDPESNFNTIKDLFKSHGNPWIIYENKADHGFLKFRSVDEGKDYIKKIKKAKQLFGEKELTYTQLEGEEEEQFNEKYNNKAGKKGRKGGKGFRKGKRRN
eukprot:TRINITY_DN663_c0_g1_i1.p1 TRINITY_DN663_c0_g1~~TRINITY_DN663_c0_g1_i1.p1  ORF type:complete len:422 (+),score=145.06 TRINITY_DN663_c0_g1_i1:51-1316(+)